jgi:hypothetical protein
MTNRVFDNRSFWVTVAVLGVLTLAMGVRARSTVATVLSPDSSASAYQQASSKSLSQDLIAVGTLDSLLISAVPGDRDPFQFPRVRQATRAKSSQKRVEKKDTPPVLRTLLYDNVDPGVRISFGSRTSGWLHTGDTFNGWTVAAITSSSVEIFNDTGRLLLSANR